MRLRGPPNAGTAAADRGLWFNKPFYTGDQDGGVIFDTFPELQVSYLEWQRVCRWCMLLILQQECNHCMAWQ
jgi:hypothetical protein